VGAASSPLTRRRDDGILPSYEHGDVVSRAADASPSDLAMIAFNLGTLQGRRGDHAAAIDVGSYTRLVTRHRKPAADGDGDNDVDFQDILVLLANWT
jgi:hypothetical protein